MQAQSPLLYTTFTLTTVQHPEVQALKADTGNARPTLTAWPSERSGHAMHHSVTQPGV